MRRRTSLGNVIDSAVDREIDSKYDKIAAVAGKIAQIEKINDAIDNGAIADVSTITIATSKVDSDSPARATIDNGAITLDIPAGKDGKDGVNGRDGAPGLPGKDGNHGINGISGTDGERGPRGYQGPVGARGLRGENSEVVSIVTNEDATLTITFNNGYTHTTPPLSGKDGRDGRDGKDGATGERGLRGLDGYHVHHIRFNNKAVGPLGENITLVAGQPDVTDEYLVFGDVEETILLGSFYIHNGANSLTRLEVKEFYESNTDTNAFTDTEKVKLADTEITSQLDTRDTTNRDRANHTGTQLANTISDFDTSVTDSTHANSITNPHAVTKAQVGLSEVDNTTDADKPISEATQAALDTKFDKTGGTITGDVTITGNTTVSGDLITVNTSTVTTSDNVIVLNQGEVGSAVTAGTSGIEIDRGTSTNAQIIFNEDSQKVEVGLVGALDAVVTSNDIVADNIAAIYESNTDTNKYTDAEVVKVSNITVTQPVDLDIIETDTNSNNAHKISDGTDHTFIDQDIRTSADVEFVTVNGREVAVDGAKLDGIEDNATRDQVASEVPLSSVASIDADNVQSAIEILDDRVEELVATNTKNKYDATTAPAATNDSEEGYSVGSVWINTADKEEYRLMDATEDAAVWQNTAPKAYVDGLKTVTATYTATAGQTEFLIGNTTSEPMTVLYEGFPIVEGTDDGEYTRAADKITLNTAADANEQLHIVAHNG